MISSCVQYCSPCRRVEEFTCFQARIAPLCDRARIWNLLCAVKKANLSPGIHRWLADEILHRCLCGPDKGRYRYHRPRHRDPTASNSPNTQRTHARTQAHTHTHTLTHTDRPRSQTFNAPVNNIMSARQGLYDRHKKHAAHPYSPCSFL